MMSTNVLVFAKVFLYFVEYIQFNKNKQCKYTKYGFKITFLYKKGLMKYNGAIH